MHTEMWEHPATQANVAMLRRRGAIVLDPARRPADRRRQRGRAAARAGRDLRRRDRRLLARGPRRCRRDLAGRRVVVSPAAPASHSTRCASSATGPPGRRATRWPARRRPAGAEVTWSRPTSRCPTRPGAKVIRVGHGRASCGRGAGRRRRRRRGGDGRRRGRLPPGGARPPRRSRRTARPSPSRSAAEPQPRRPRRARHGASRRPAGQVVVGFAAETGDDDGDVLAHARAKLARKGCDLLVVNEVGGRARVRHAGQRGRVVLRRRRRGHGGRRAAPRTLWPTWCGTCVVRRLLSRIASDCRLTSPQSAACQSLTPQSAQSRQGRTPSVTSPVHLRVGDRGPPGQDRRPDQRLRSSTRCSRRTRQPGRRGDPDHHRPGARRRRGDHRRRTSTSPRIVRETILEHRLRLLRARASTARPAACRVSIGAQSPDIAQGVDTRATRRARARATTSSTARAPATRA